MLSGGLGVKTGVIFRREGVDESSETFHLFRDTPGRSFRGTFEEKMLQKVRDPAEFLRFMASTDCYPDAYAHAFHLRHLARGDPDSVFQTRCLILHSTSRLLESV